MTDRDQLRAENELLGRLDFEPVEGWLCDARMVPCHRPPVWKFVMLCCGYYYPVCAEHHNVALEDAARPDVYCVHCGGTGATRIQPLTRRASL